jgi:spore germination cell wall hydrolase CwlJ-like protein
MESEKKNPFKNLTDMQLMALCIYGEARNQGLEGMRAVGSVVINRARKGGWFGKTIYEVILRSKQFSCFNEDDPGTPANEEDINRIKLVEIAEDFSGAVSKNPWLKEAYWVALGILDGYLRSNVREATNYHADYAKPSWANEMRFVKKIGNHLFYA